VQYEDRFSGGHMKIVRDEMMADVAIASAGHFKAEPMAV
jgi:hypothetical protein